jgi:hypothetical protein
MLENIQCIDVQPNDGFGTLLPLETSEVDIIFQPPKADTYSVDVVCKTMIGRYFLIILTVLLVATSGSNYRWSDHI